MWFIPNPITPVYGPNSLRGMRHADLRRLIQDFFGLDRLSGPLRILDIGCGDCSLLSSLEAPNRQLSGCDWLFPVNENPKIKYAQVDLNSNGLAPYADNSFDLIICSDVIEHLEAPATILRETARVLHPEGLAFFSFPNSWNMLERARFFLSANFRRYRSERISGPFGHISLFTPDIFESLCDRAKLDIKKLCGGSGSSYAAAGGYFMNIPPTLLLSYNVYAVLACRS